MKLLSSVCILVQLEDLYCLLSKGFSTAYNDFVNLYLERTDSMAYTAMNK